VRHALKGGRIDPAALRGRVVVVKFFAKYCRPCQRTLPSIERLHQTRPELVIIGVARDDSERDVRATVRGYRLTFPVIHDHNDELAAYFFVAELPATFVADARGVVRWVGGPDQDESDLRRAVDAL
jgi:thiol-disulfide isomerase/thioredoxin